MDTQIFENKNLGLVVAEVVAPTECGKVDCCKGDKCWSVRNPRALQAYPTQTEQGGMQLSVQVNPIVFAEILADPEKGYLTSFSESEYKIVTKQFSDQVIQMYESAEGALKDEFSSDDEEENVVKLH